MPPQAQSEDWDALRARIDELIEKLSAEAAQLGGEPALVTHARQRHALADAVNHLAAIAAAPSAPEELVAEELRLAARSLGRVGFLAPVEGDGTGGAARNGFGGGDSGVSFVGWVVIGSSPGVQR